MKLYCKVGMFLLFSLGLVFSAAAGGNKEEKPVKEKKIVLRFAETNATNDPIVDSARTFAKAVLEKTKGRIQIDVFPSGQLGTEKESVIGAQMGALDITRVKPGILSDMGVKVVQVYSLPYIFDDIKHARKVLRSDTGKKILDKVQASGVKLVGIGYYANEPRCFFFRNREVSSLKDMAGLKLRVMPGQIYIDLAAAFGASPTPIAFSELYSALQTGIVDGAEQPLVPFYAQKFYEVCKYFTFDNHQADPSVVLISEITWNALSPSDRTILKESLEEASLYYDQRIDTIESKYIEEMRKVGVKFTQLNDMDKWQDAAAKLYPKYGAGFEKEIEAIRSLK